MIIYTPEFLLYPVTFFLLILVGFIMVKGHPALTGIIVVAVMIFWVILFIVLSFLKSKSLLPCLHLLSNNIGGCL